MATNPKTRQILTKIVDTLSAVAVSGGYNNTLTDPGQVQIGEGIRPGSQALVVDIGEPRIRSEHGPQLGRYNRALEIPFVARAPSVDNSPTGRIYAALDLSDDIHTALETDRSLGGLVVDLIISSDTFNGAEVGWSNAGGVSGIISVYFRVQRGT